MKSPTPTSDGSGRDSSGRFATGNRCGRGGNPHAARASSLRAALYEAVTVDDVRAIIRALVQEALSGNVPAAREILDRCLGKPEPLDLLLRLDELEQRLASWTSGEGVRP